MSSRRAVLLAGAALLSAGAAGTAWRAAGSRSTQRRSGILVAEDPIQTPLADTPAPLSRAEWTLRPLAQFRITGRVLGLRSYSADSAAALAPLDLALGWGRMSDEAVIEKLDIAMTDRSYHWTYWGPPPLPHAEMVRHSANLHLIPASAAIMQSLESLRPGAIARLEGWLVEATHPQAPHPWTSSLTREDEGEGACEILYTLSAHEMPPPDRH